MGLGAVGYPLWLGTLGRDALGWEASVCGLGLYPLWDLGSPANMRAEFESRA